MRPLFLLPPSEGKCSDGEHISAHIQYGFDLPLDIARQASQKDLKCIGKRYEEGIQLNHTVETSRVLPAMYRYTGVMFKGISHATMTPQAQTYFNEHIHIISGMYGLVTPTDLIANYKLPIDTKGLRDYRKNTITQTLAGHTTYDTIINLLPQAHQKVIDFSLLPQHIIHIDFMIEKDGENKKMTHGVKKVKGQRLRDICEQQTLPFSISSEKEQHIAIVV